MASQIYYPPFLPAFSSNGAPVPGAMLNFYISGTTTRVMIYADAEMTVPLPNPVQANSAGRYPNIYMDAEGVYRVVQTGPDGIILGDAMDPYYPGQAVSTVADLPELIAPDGAAKVGFGTSSVEEALQGSPVSLLTAGKPSGGVFPYAALTAAMTLAADRGVGVVDLAGQTVFIPAGVTTWSRSRVEIRNGTLRGPAVAAQQQPTAYIKLWGSVSADVSYTSAIAQGTRSFTVAQAYNRGDLLLLSDYPTDASDAIASEGPVDAFGFRTRAYGTPATTNKRQFRRKEILSVRSASSSAFTCETATAHGYSTEGLKFQRIDPLTGVTFQNVRFENVGLYLRHTRDLAFLGCTAHAAQMAAAMAYNTRVDFTDWDCADTDGRVDFFEASKGIRITGSYRNFNSPADNGPVKVNGCLDTRIDVIVEGIRGGLGHAVMIDTNYDEAPSGYPDLPCRNFSINAVVRDCDGAGVFATCDPYAAKAEYGTVTITAANSSYILKAVENVTLTATCDFVNGQGFTSTIVGTDRCTVIAQQPGVTFESDVVRNPRNTAQTRGNTALASFINGRMRFAGSPGQLGAYESGTWTPALRINGSSAGVTYAATPKGRYVRIGDMVTAWFSIAISSKGSPPASSPIRMAGLPFVSAGGAGDERPGVVGRCLNMTALASAVTLTTDPGDSTISLWHTGATGSVMLNSDNLTNTSVIDGTVHFTVVP